MRNIRQFVTGGLLGVAAVTAQAQAMKPGLWEISNKMLGGSGEMQAAMAEMQKEMENMPPEERKMMQDMMAKHGTSISPSGAAMSVKICLTQEMINRNQINRQEGNCRHTLSPKVGNSLKFSITCSDPVASGEGVITFISPTAYDTSMTLKTTQNGQPETMKMASSSRFLSANCGSILPIVVPAK